MYLQETAEQQALRTELRAYFDQLLNPEVRAEIGHRGEGGEGWRRIVRQMGADGWLGIGWPKEFGGQGRPPTDQFIFYDEVQRAGAPIPFVVTATGLGTTARQPAPHGVAVEAAWAGGEWTVVFSRAQAGAGVPLRGGTSTPLALAIWQGAAEERAGLASHTPGWLSLELPG